MPFRTAFACARATSVASPSTPTTEAARRARGRLKLPSPQNRSSARSAGFGSSSSIARPTMTRFSAPFTCTKSVGANSMPAGNPGKP
jgi:hypothetical protein